jgi:SAM-dependent methyltransferase
MKPSAVLYQHLEEVHNTKSPSVILPILFQVFKPSSVLDVGAGLGTWLKVCTDLGVTEILGIDGEYVDMSKVVIPREYFSHKDLTKLTHLDKRYDLTICLEVAEHLPEFHAQNFVKFLSSTSDTILFSAAIPFQGGQGHVNEKPLPYWIALFQEYGYKLYDFIRPTIWDNETIEWWYKQNIVLFSRRILSIQDNNISFYGKSLVHPDCYSARMSKYKSLISLLCLDSNKHDSMSYEIPKSPAKLLNYLLRLGSSFVSRIVR